MNVQTQLKIRTPSTSFQNKREGEAIGQDPLCSHRTKEFDSIVEAIVGNQATNHGIPKKYIGLRSLAEDEARVAGVPKIEAGAQDHVEKIVVLVETKAEKPSVGMLEVLEGVETLKKALLGLQSFGKYRGGSVGQDCHNQVSTVEQSLESNDSTVVLLLFYGGRVIYALIFPPLLISYYYITNLKVCLKLL